MEVLYTIAAQRAVEDGISEGVALRRICMDIS
jgi:hypothetical protein